MGFLAFANKIGFQKYYGRQDYAQDKRFGGDADFDGNWASGTNLSCNIIVQK